MIIESGQEDAKGFWEGVDLSEFRAKVEHGVSLRLKW